MSSKLAKVGGVLDLHTSQRIRLLKVLRLDKCCCCICTVCEVCQRHTACPCHTVLSLHGTVDSRIAVEVNVSLTTIGVVAMGLAAATGLGNDCAGVSQLIVSRDKSILSCCRWVIGAFTETTKT